VVAIVMWWHRMAIFCSGVGRRMNIGMPAAWRLGEDVWTYLKVSVGMGDLVEQRGFRAV